MFHLLLVEDDPDLRRTLPALMREAFPESRIDTAETSDEGHELLRQSLAKADPYDVAVIDCRLPRSAVTPADIQYTVGEAFRDSSPETVLIHITSFMPGSKIGIDLIKRDLRFETTRMLVRKGPNWAEELMLALRKSFEGRIEREIDFVCGRGSFVVSRRGGAHLPSDAGLSVRFSDLCVRLEKLWPTLSPPLQDKVEDTFGVRTTGGVVRVGTADAPNNSVEVERDL